MSKDVFQRNGLHHIPYRDSKPGHLPIPVYDGQRWPDEEEAQGLPQDEPSSDVVDVWSRRAEQHTEAVRQQVTYHDIPHDTLSKLLRAIKHPVEIRLLPHIVREWHRQGLPITEIAAHKIARLTTLHGEVDIVFQMINPEVYGLYYDIDGIRDITRGLAKQATESMGTDAQHPESFRPEGILRRVPELLNCCVGSDSKQILRDPVIFGTVLWAFVARFVNDESFRKGKQVLEMCELTERLVNTLPNSDFQMTLSSYETLHAESSQETLYKIKSLLVNYLPVKHALQQFMKILDSPYRACLTAIQKVRQHDEASRTTETCLRDYLASRPAKIESHLTLEAKDVNKEEVESNNLRWEQLNDTLRTQIKSRLLQPNLADWQWSLLNRYTIPATGSQAQSRRTSIESDAFYLPIRAQSALRQLGEHIIDAKKLLKRENIKWRSRLELKEVSIEELLR